VFRVRVPARPEGATNSGQAATRLIDRVRLDARRTSRSEEFMTTAIASSRSLPKASDRAEPIGRRTPPRTAKASGQSRSRTGRAATEARARRLLEKPDTYVYNSQFDRPDAEASFLAPIPDRDPRPAVETKTPTGIFPYVASVYRNGLLLRPEQEVFLFLKMNYLKHRASKLRDDLDPRDAQDSTLDEIERLELEAQAIRNQIVMSCLRLVLCHVRKRVGHDQSFYELVSEANLTLIVAAQKFDVSRGFKFSTYASCAIIRRVARQSLVELALRRRFATGHDERFDGFANAWAAERETGPDHPRRANAVQALLGRLGDRERQIVVARHDLDGSGKLTLVQLSKILGISTERVRQLEMRSLKKLRGFASRAGLAPELP
jgi:RNA polymerase primary sigma factor